MTDTLTIIGKVATDPTRGQTAGGIPVTNFRLASTPRRFDNATRTWVDGETNWFSVAAFRQLGEHVKASLRTGDSVIVTGRLRVRTWESNGRHGTSVDIDADAVGHDLRWGTSAYLRASRAAPADEARGQGEGRESDAGAMDTRAMDGGEGDDRATERPPTVGEDLDAAWSATDAVEASGRPF